MNETAKPFDAKASADAAAAHVIDNLNNLPPDDWAGASIRCDRFKRQVDDALTDGKYGIANERLHKLLEEVMTLRLYIRAKIVKLSMAKPIAKPDPIPPAA